ncbi:hypothetical protein M422DRAFT_182724, partial [Sphaerobolus stellatus SS14]
GEFQVGFISLEMVKNKEFDTRVTQEAAFKKRILCVCYDEAHTILEWGSSFRPDYKEVGDLLQGQLDVDLPVYAVSATLSSHLIKDLHEHLCFRSSSETTSFSNAHPNIALSVHPIQHQETFGDLQQIKPILVYFNGRIEAEKMADFLIVHLPEGVSCSIVAFYHSQVGDKHKKEIIDGFEKGKIRAIMVTEALGMVSLHN